MAGMRMARRLALSGAVLLIGFTAPALAHAGEGGFVLLLPTDYYLAGGTLAVAASFLLIAFAPEKPVERIIDARIALIRFPVFCPISSSLVSLLVLAVLVWEGFDGTQDPLQNPLPLVVWTLWWIGFTLLTAIFGNLWRFLNPWTGLYRLLRPSRMPLIHYPKGLGYWPAVGLFFAFAWFELIDPAPANPERLAIALSCYWIFMFAATFAFGEEDWLGKAEPFSLFFRLIALLAPLQGERSDQSVQLFLGVPGAKALKADRLPVSGVFFVLLALATVSFDGLSKTFLWLGFNGINPLEFPGRSAVIGRNTAGLLATWVVLAAVYIYAVRLGWMLAGSKADPRQFAGRLVLSIMPIALAYHFAHYLTLLLVNGQYAIAALLPVDVEVTTSFLMTYGGVRFIWNIEALAIVAGHVLAIMLAHAIALDCCGRGARRAEFPIAIAMVLYTLFGLWLLATPTAG
jgi:hypothetical protein